MQTYRALVKDLVPPALLKTYRRLVPFPYGWFGNYPNWEAARSDATGYDADLILEKVKAALLKVKRGEAVYERDSVLYDQVQYSWPLLAGLMWIAAQRNGRLNVVEYRKSVNDFRLIFQLINAFLFKITHTSNRRVNLIVTLFIMSPVNLLGEIVGFILPRNQDLYLDSVVLAQKITHA